MPGKIAFCTPPHVGGIYSVYQRMRAACARHGWDVRCVYPASEINRWGQFDRTLADEGVVELGRSDDTLIDSARTFVNWVRDEGVSVVVPMSMRSCLSAIPHLPTEVRVVTRCINVTPLAYRLATACLSRTDAVVTTSPRQGVDLARAWRVESEIIRHIPNAVDVGRFNPGNRSIRQDDGPIRIGVVDRLLDRQKRVLLIPKILDALSAEGVDWRLDVVGTGPDEVEFRRLMTQVTAPHDVHFHGALPLSQVADQMRNFDILLKPSLNEGFPSSLIEAMACGVVPVVSHISGVTDWIVNSDLTGMLCRMGNADSFTRALAHLSKNPAKLDEMAARAASDIAARFGAEEFGTSWATLFEEVCERKPLNAPLDWKEFELASPFQPRRGLRRIMGLVPSAVKQRMRTAIENNRARNLP